MRQHITSLPALACFRVAAELESFSKAADRLNLTHGAVSRAVRLLEEDLGTSLFERRNRAVFLTDAGRRLAQVVARGLGEIEEEAQRIKAEHANAPVTVSCEPTLMMRWLIPGCRNFMPRIRAPMFACWQAAGRSSSDRGSILPSAATISPAGNL